MKINPLIKLKDTLAKYTEMYAKHIDRYQYALIWVVVITILLWGIHLFNRPVSIAQRQEVAAYTGQYLYPHTRELSSELVQQTAITQYQYFKFLRVLYFEKNRIHFQQDKPSL